MALGPARMSRIGWCILSAVVLTLGGAPGAAAGVLSGEAFYLERIALPPDAVLEVSLLDVTRADRPGELIVAVQIRPRGQVPIPFEIRFADAEIEPRRIYAVKANIIADGRLRFAAANLPRVLTQGNPSDVRIRLTAISGGELHGVTGKTWLAQDIGGRGVIDNVQSKISIANEGEVIGSAGCNTLRGAARIEGRSLAFGMFATTRKMCPPALMDQEARFLRALDRTRGFRMDGPHLTFVDAGGAEVIRFTELR